MDQLLEQWALTSFGAIQDKMNNSTRNQEQIVRMEQAVKAHRDSMLDSIAKLQTNWFKVFHPKESQYMNEVAEMLRNAPCDLEQHYLEIMQGSL